jgi:hypothetical protein
MAKTTTKKTDAKTAPVGAATKNKERGVWHWLEKEKGRVWESALLPEGDLCIATIKRSFSKELDGTYKFYAYRSGRIMGRRDTVQDAQHLAESGKADDRKDAVYDYAKNHSGDVPMFLRLTEDERRQVRQHFKYDAPRQSDLVKFAKERGATDVKDPSTRKFLEELAKTKAVADEGAAKTPRAASAKTSTPRPARSDVDPAAVMSRTRDGNPKKAGSGAYARWTLMFTHCDRGSTVGEFLAAGGNPETLRNAIIKGFAAVTGGKK